MYKFPIIVFEGIEGSGKSYHIKNIKNYLKKKKIKFIILENQEAQKMQRKLEN